MAGPCISKLRSSRPTKGICVYAVDWGNGADATFLATLLERQDLVEAGHLEHVHDLGLHVAEHE